ncbi:uncharacterized protein DSM5745_11260 [Aspergillus mulundensis]|uniref:Uncharacterized protein n=1 Tax=Aspergillus mulundensis TaxID=1810919 RepID=A0A3D8Q9U4_9EURO|nr:hypothetical protein DSM5745_11260 [Aspergillus mulundensis]RDW58569.1 hypothetical protein DSM5745_11260 [Aspergillus mulundensis]
MNSTSPDLEGWTFNDNSRSSWDIVWTCLTTIFACTWTVQHMSVPRRNTSEGLITARRWILFTVALFAPEETVLLASDQFWHVWSLQARCNAAQAESDRKTGHHDSWLVQRAKPLAPGAVTGISEGDLHPVPTRWTLGQCWCVQMDGVTLETADGWIFYVGMDQMTAFIEAGVIRCSDFSEREIKDRAKADTFAKLFTICQSAWVTANIVARAGYGLPITPFEFTTLAHVACGIMAYACWWRKPQDMAVPITIPLRHTREGLPIELKRLMDARPKSWMHRHVIPPRESISTGFAIVGGLYQTAAVDAPRSGVIKRGYRGLSLQAEWWLNTFAAVAAGAFCGIHVAAWAFPFPTPTETLAWRTFSLVALSMAIIVYILGQAPLAAQWLKQNGAPLPSFMDNLSDPAGRYTWVEIYVPLICIAVYAVARLGLVALTFSSLRALPTGAYLGVDWLGSIPHV